VAGVSVFNKETLELLEKHGKMENAFEEMIAKGKRISAAVWEKEWAEFTYPWDILNANRIVMDRDLRGKGSFIAESASVHPTVIIEGSVYIDEGTIIRPYTTLKGPLYIGKQVYIGNNSLIRDYCSICDGVTIGYAVEIRNTMVFERVNIGRMTYLADSLIGADTCIEAGAQLWNWRPGENELYLKDENETVQIPSKKFGAIIGDRVVIGVNASIFPATRIGENSVISAGCVVNEDIPPNSEVTSVQKLKISKRKNDASC
jgi:bifunctional UDP-N-acetylglucosamine pyrophosphorylase/glucosamine-1-phosphate N-acetyltransferase